MDELEVRLLEERLRGTDRVGGIRDDNVVSGLVFCQELKTVPYDDCDPARGQQRCHVGQIQL